MLCRRETRNNLVSHLNPRPVHVLLGVLSLEPASDLENAKLETYPDLFAKSILLVPGLVLAVLAAYC